jgi:hypothetical protein
VLKPKGSLKRENLKNEAEQPFTWGVSTPLIDSDSGPVDREKVLKDFFRHTVMGGVNKVFDLSIKKETSRLNTVYWILMGWLARMELLKNEEHCVDLVWEAQIDLEASVYLALSGFIKQAVQTNLS